MASVWRRLRKNGSRPHAAYRPARYIHREFRAVAHSRASTAPRGGCRDGPYFLVRFLDRSAPPFPDSLPRLTPQCSMRERRPQVESQGEFHCAILWRRVDPARRVAVILKPGEPARLGLVGIDGFGVIGAPAGMGDMVDAAAQRAVVPTVDQIERQRRMDGNGRVQAGCRLPRLEADGRDCLTRAAGWRHRHPPAVAGDDVAALDEAFRLDLQSFDRGID